MFEKEAEEYADENRFLERIPCRYVFRAYDRNYLG